MNSEAAGAFVYVIGSVDGAQKIGVTGDVGTRFLSLQNGSPTRLAVAFSARCESKRHAEAVERQAHADLARARLNGEWFAVKPDEATEVVRGAATKLGCQLAEVSESTGARGETFTLPHELAERVDRWRRRQPTIPSKSRAFQDLIRRGLDVEESEREPTPPARKPRGRG